MQRANANAYQQVSRVLSRTLDTVVVLLLGAVVAIVLAQVFSRYVLGFSLIWSGELVRLLHVWMIMLAAAQARHMRITVLTDILPRPLRRMLDWFALAVTTICLGLLVWGSWRIALMLWNDTYTRLPLSPALLFVAVCAGGAFWLAVVLARTASGSDPDDITGPDPANPKAPPAP